LPTTTRSSERLRWLPAATALWLLLGAGGCESAPPPPLFALPTDAPANKAAQTRVFETKDANELMSASAAVLQDLGFHIEECAREVGFLRAAKDRSARETGQELLRLFVLALSLGRSRIPIDLQQRIAATLVAQPADAAGRRHEVRVVFFRVVWAGDGQLRDRYVPPGRQQVEMIRDPFVYQQFFAKLSKAVFLEPFTL
jgi:hypothetical protein